MDIIDLIDEPSLSEDEEGCEHRVQIEDHLYAQCCTIPGPKLQVLWKYHGCNVCSYKTSSFITIKSHLRRHRVTRISKTFRCSNDSIGKYKCSSCSYKAALLLKFNRHVWRVHGPIPNVKLEREGHLKEPNTLFSNKIFTCRNCACTTSSRIVFINHRCRCPEMHSEDIQMSCITSESATVCSDNSAGRYRCRDCLYIANSHKNLFQHVKKVHKLFQCVKCYITVKNQNCFTNHMLQRHSKDTDIEWLFCKQCSFQTLFPKGLMFHVMKIHTTYDCEQCSFKTKRKNLLSKHLSAEHNSSNLKSGVKEAPNVFLVKCELCSFETVEDRLLREHILELHVAAEKVVCFKCQLCTFKTLQQAELEDHILEKHIDPQNAEWFCCKLCPFKFKNKLDLRQHIFTQHFV